MVWVLVHVIAPLGAATWFAVAYRRGGGWRLWGDAALLAMAISGIAFWYPNIYFYHHGPLSAEGVETIFYVPAVLIATAVVHALLRPGMPAVFPVGVAALLASLFLFLGHWIA